jgi:hypothetical protein
MSTTVNAAPAFVPQDLLSTVNEVLEGKAA